MPLWLKKKDDNQPAHRPASPAGGGQGYTNIVAGTKDMTPWKPVSGLPFPGLDLEMFFSGSISKVIPSYIRATQFQGIANSNAAALTAVVTTPDDLVVVKDRLWVPPESVSMSVRQGRNTYTAVHPNQAALIADSWQTLGNYIGCGSDPDLALKILQTDPLATQSVDRLVDQTMAQLRRHNLVGGCALLEHVGLGGSYVIGEYGIQRFDRSSLDVTRRSRVLYLGSEYQFLNRRIARRWLSEFLNQPVPTDTLLFLVSLDHPGPQEWDLALAHGMLTVHSTDRYFGQGDAHSHFKRLKDRGDIVEVTARIVPMPLRERSKKNWLGRKETYYVVEDSPVPALLATLKQQIESVPCRYRLVTFHGDFTDAEAEELKRRTYLMAPRGALEVLINKMLPITHDHERADYYLVDFRIYDGQPPSLLDLLSDDGTLPSSSANWGREELVARLGHGNGGNGRPTAEAVTDLLAANR